MDKRLKILIVDDEPYITYMMCYKLQQLGLDAVAAGNGVEALASVAAGLPDLILTDYQMPEMDGVEFCQALATDPVTARIPIILLTARSHRIAPSILVNTSICHLISKPFSFHEIIQRIAEILPAANVSLANAVTIPD